MSNRAFQMSFSSGPATATPKELHRSIASAAELRNGVAVQGDSRPSGDRGLQGWGVKGGRRRWVGHASALHFSARSDHQTELGG